jgi:hypothetical protein
MGKDFSDVKLYAAHIDDTPPDADHLRPDTVEQGAGSLEVGVLIDGVKKVLYRGKAGGFLDDLKRHEDAQAKQALANQQAQTVEPSPSPDDTQPQTPNV